jgi:outer membrane lipoprotein-sorting protein
MFQIVFCLMFFLSAQGFADPKPNAEPTAPKKEETKPVAVKKAPPAKVETAAKPKAVPTVPAFDLAALVDKVQTEYIQTKTAIFEFKQVYHHQFLPVNESSTGHGSYKERNMLWRYETPADKQKSFYIQGKNFTYYQPRDQIAFTHNCFEKDTLSASIPFLWGRGNIKQYFIVTKTVSPPSTDLRWINLVPKESHPQVKSIDLGIDAKLPVVRRSIVKDASGSVSDFTFTNLKTNLAIPDAVFKFVPPEGVRIMPMPGVTCPEVVAPPTKPSTLPPPKPVAKPAPASAPAPSSTPSTTSAPAAPPGAVPKK